MLAKIWKKVILVLVIIACIYTISLKLMKKLSFSQEMEQAVDDYVKTVNYNGENTTANNAINSSTNR